RKLRDLFAAADGIPGNAYGDMDASTPFGAQANERILTILGQVPLETAAIAAYERAAGTLVTLWDSDRNDSDRQKRRHERNFFAEARLSAMMQEFLLRT